MEIHGCPGAACSSKEAEANNNKVGNIVVAPVVELSEAAGELVEAQVNIVVEAVGNKINKDREMKTVM